MYQAASSQPGPRLASAMLFCCLISLSPLLQVLKVTNTRSILAYESDDPLLNDFVVELENLV